MRNTLFLAVLLGAFASCSKPATDPDPVARITSADITILGCSNDSLLLWRNDSMIVLNRGFAYNWLSTRPGQLLLASDSSVYIAANENSKAILYKNGVKTIVHPATGSLATSVCVANGHVYVGGSTMDNNGSNLGEQYATVWDNGVRKTDWTPNVCISALCVLGSDLYAAGEKIRSGPIGGTYDRPYMTKNYQPFTTLFNYESYVMGMTVHNNQLYAAGTTVLGNGYYAALWENGNETAFRGDPGSGHSTNAKGVYFSGNDMYIYGGLNNQPGYWKNGNPVYLDPNIGGAVYDLKVVGNDVYAVGNHYNVFSRTMVAALWKNDRLIKELNGSAGLSSAFGIIVK